VLFCVQQGEERYVGSRISKMDEWNCRNGRTMGEFMIEIIALAAAAALVPAIAAFTWIVKKRLDELQVQIDVVFEQFVDLKRKLTSRAILRKAGEE
jgi:hypothetical protein